MTSIPKLAEVPKRKPKPKKVWHERTLKFPVDEMLIKDSILQRMKRVMEER
jgi:hypothetical protein